MTPATCQRMRGLLPAQSAIRNRHPLAGTRSAIP
jgi:hypothetical protein